MIYLLSDFGVAGPYAGLMEAALRRDVATPPVIQVMHDLPAFDPGAAGVLVAAIAANTPAGSVLVCVVDPGVGTDRPAAVVEADGRWYVGPDNGLFDTVLARARKAWPWRVLWRPDAVSATFHGRDWFAPLAARIATGDRRWGVRSDSRVAPQGHNGERILYIDSFGNAMTGLFGTDLGHVTRLRCADQVFSRVRTFADAAAGAPVWLVNSIGLAELCLYRDSCARCFGLAPGDRVIPAQ